MGITGPSFSKDVTTAAVVNMDPKALANAYAYSVKKAEDGRYLATVAELPLLTNTHGDFISAQSELKILVATHLASLAEASRPIPVGIANKTKIDRAKEVPAHIRKSYGREMAQ